MIRFHGETWFSPVLERFSLDAPGRNIVLPMSEVGFEAAERPWSSADPLLLKVALNRLELRKLIQANGWRCPACKIINSIAEGSAWLMKNNRFPAAIKSVCNTSDGVDTFRLEAYRELPIFFEKIQKKFPGPVLLEEWVDSSSLIEVTMLGDKPFLVSRIELQRKLTAAVQTRTFPVGVPKGCTGQISAFLSFFRKLAGDNPVVLRLCIALGEDSATLISLNIGINRLEYFPGWCRGTSLVEAIEGLSANDKNPSDEIFRVQFFRTSSKGSGFLDTPGSELAVLNPLNYFSRGKTAGVLFSAINGKSLAQKAILIAHAMTNNIV